MFRSNGSSLRCIKRIYFLRSNHLGANRCKRCRCSEGFEDIQGKYVKLNVGFALNLLNWPVFLQIDVGSASQGLFK